MVDKINTVAENVEKQIKSSGTLEQALAVAGLGMYNIRFCLVLGLCLISSITEPVGYSFVLPAAMCDLDMSDSQRGFIASIPYIGIVLTSFPWGYLVDTKGRKKILIYSSFAAGIFGIASGFMPNLITFILCKSLASLCIACPAAAPYTYIGEILPAKQRDLMLSITNAMQISGAAIVPLLAWAILPLDFRIDFGLYDFRPWRLLTMVYSTIFIINAILLCFGPESPKYLVSQGKLDEALKIIQAMYAGNKKKSPEDFPIKRLDEPVGVKLKAGFFSSLKAQSWPLITPPFLKWMCLNGFLMFGLFSILNGLFMWVPDILNRVMTGGGGGRTACEIIYDRLNQTASEDAVCVDTIDQITFVISSIANVSCAVIAIAVSSTVKVIGKKRLIIIVYWLIGLFCILINFITLDMLFAVLLSSFPLTALAIGPLNAFSLEIFPLQLRGMAVSLVMMVGRLGSVFGTNVAGILLNVACDATFYSFGGLFILCGALSFLLPNSQGSPQKPAQILITRL